MPKNQITLMPAIRKQRQGVGLNGGNAAVDAIAKFRFDKHDLIVRLDHVLGILDCVETLADPSVDLSGFDLAKKIRSVADAAGAAGLLVFEIQQVLIESPE